MPLIMHSLIENSHSRSLALIMHSPIENSHDRSLALWCSLVSPRLCWHCKRCGHSKLRCFVALLALRVPQAQNCAA